MNVLDLFSAAAGGWSLGMHRAGFRTVAACESVEWRRKLYAENNPGVVIYDDVCTLTADRIVSDLGYFPSVVVGSPPCQDVSPANTKGKGVEGERSGLFFEAVRIIGEGRPRWLALENSANLRTRGADAVLAALEELGYSCWPRVVRAGDIGANHDRARSWLIGCDVEQVTDHFSDAKGLGCQSGRPRRHGSNGDGAPPVTRSDACHSSQDGCGQGWTRRRAEPASGLSVETCWDAAGNAAHADQAGQTDGCLEPSLRQAAQPDTGRRDERRDDVADADGEGQPDRAFDAEMGRRANSGDDAAEPWAEWNGGPSSYLWLDARLRAWAFLALCLEEGGMRWEGERLIAAVKSAKSAALPSIEPDMAVALRTALASYSESTVRNLAPIAGMLSDACNITLVPEKSWDATAKSAEETTASASIISTQTGPTTRRKTSKRSARPATQGTTCELDLKAVHRRAERRLKLFDRRQVEAFGDAVVPQIPEAIGRAILRTEAALSAIYARTRSMTSPSNHEQRGSGMRALAAASPTPSQLAQHEAWLRARSRLSAPLVEAKPALVVRPYVRKRVFLRYIPPPTPHVGGFPEPPALFDDSIVGTMPPPPAARLMNTARPARKIAAEVAEAHNLPLRALMGVRRDRVHVVARQEAMWRIATETSLSLSQIGRLFDKDHTTVLHSIRKHEERMRAGQG